MTRYNLKYLQQYCREKHIELLEDYKEDVNRDTIIHANCLRENCNGVVKKTFRNITNSGCYCIDCTKNNTQEKKKETCIKNHGVEHPLQSKDVKQKIKATNMEKYGVECTLQNKEVREKVKATNIERYGVEHSLQNKEVREKVKATCI